ALLVFLVGVTGGAGPLPRKPDPGGLHALRAQVNARPEETLVIGDSWVDVETERQTRARAGLCAGGAGAARGGQRAARGGAGDWRFLGRRGDGASGARAGRFCDVGLRRAAAGG